VASRAHAARRPPERRACPATRHPSQPRCPSPGQLCAPRKRIQRLPRIEAPGCPLQPRRTLVGRARSHTWLDPLPTSICFEARSLRPPLPARSSIKAPVCLLVRARAHLCAVEDHVWFEDRWMVVLV
jgi:hypothetical protein